MSVLPVGIGSSGGYEISRSVRLRSSASAYFGRTFGAASGSTRGTWAGWVKRGQLGTSQMLWSASNFEFVQFMASDKLRISNPSGTPYWDTTMVFRDPSAWYHIVIAFDTTLATAADRCRLWVNGVQITQWDASATITQNTTFARWNVNGQTGSIGRFDFNGTSFFDGHQTEIHWIDGQTPNTTTRTVGGVTQTVLTDLGEFDSITGVWKPKRYTGTYGTNGFYLNFSDNSNNTAATIGKDNSGNGNNWTPNNISVTAGVTYDSMIDSPTMYADGGNGRGNYAVLNPLDYGGTAVKSIITEGNLKGFDAGSGSYNSTSVSSIGVTSGKFYCEFTSITAFVQAGILYGLPTSDITAAGVRYYGSNGIIYKDGVSQGTFATYTTNNVIGLALDADAKTIAFYKNNTLITTITYTSTNPVYLGALFPNTGGGGIYANFGQRPFSYTPPTGFKALNTQNLPEGTIKKGSQYFDATLWSGNGTSGRVITTNVETVDFAWVKKRNGIDDHRLANSVLGGNKHLKSNATDAESTGTTVIQAFSGSTFTVGSDNSVNASGGTYAGWTWKESVSAGFDIVTYTGDGSSTRTVAHSLGVAPKMIIIKSRDGARPWAIAHDYGAFTWSSDYFQFDTGGKYTNAAGTIFRAAPTPSVFNLGTNVVVNQNTERYVAYLFSEVAGYSKFGSYTGNGAADGPFVYLGFRPRFLMIKNITNAQPWIMIDTARNTYNVAGDYLQANSSGIENALSAVSTATADDILSNGFKLRNNASSSGYTNASANTYIYAAFAENPFKNSLAR